MSTVASNETLPILDLPGECTRGLGALRVKTGEKRSSLPLAAVEISGRVADRVAQIELKQTFHNPYTDHLEAVYIFPLPGGSAVSDFEMRVGQRVIKGVVQERAQARQQYQQALNEGKRAALLEQERDDVFTVQLGNLPPGEEITVMLSYSERLPYFDNGTTELRLPLVVAPRYIAGNPQLDRPEVGDGIELDTDIVGDASRISPPRLVKGFDPKVALGISVALEMDDDSSIEDLSCSQHATRTNLAQDTIKVSLSRDDEPLNRDFVLRWRIATEKLRTSFSYFKDPTDQKCYGMVSILPPRKQAVAVTARDVIFVVDRSGSMGGVKMSSAARACSLLLATLGPQDRFAVQCFDNSTEYMPVPGSAAERFLFADERGLDLGNKYLRSITARGGTELYHALREAISCLKQRSNASGRMPVIVLLTDGQVGDEARILKEIQTQLDDSRVFTVGIDTAVNEGFLKRLAALGGGTATFVSPGAQLESALKHVGREIGVPLVTDISIKDVSAGIEGETCTPSHIADLFVGRATGAFFCFKKSDKNTKILIEGKNSDGTAFHLEVKGKHIALPAIGHMWAKTRIADLEDLYRVEPQNQPRLKQQIIDIAVAHSILTKFTAFVVVDESEIVNKDNTRRKVVQPVEQPHLWEEAGDSLPQRASSSLMGQLVRQRCAAPADQAWGAPSLQRESWDCASAPAQSQASWSSPPAAPAPQPPAAPPPPGGFCQMVSKAASIFGAPKQPAGGAANGQQAAAISLQLRADFEAFARAFVELIDALRKRQAISLDSFESARRTLLNSLAQSNVAHNLVLLQRFLRSEAVTIVAVGRANGANVSDIDVFCNSMLAALEKVKIEIDAPAPHGSNFWDGSI
jgi:Ca-activated chloride channel family protein